MFVENPLLGGGMGSASITSAAQVGNVSHNIYVDIIGDFGIIGTSAIALCGIHCAGIFKKKDLSYMFGFFCSAFMPLFFINGFTTMTFWLPVTLLVIFANFSKSNEIQIKKI